MEPVGCPEELKQTSGQSNAASEQGKACTTTEF
jgi:hypothetical protein